MEPEVDIFLPFWWIAMHQPQGAWDSSDLPFSSPSCLNDCTQKAVTEFTLSLDESILQRSQAHIMCYDSAVTTEDADPLDLVPDEFRQYLGIMSREAAEALPEHHSYNCR